MTTSQMSRTLKASFHAKRCPGQRAAKGLMWQKPGRALRGSANEQVRRLYLGTNFELRRKEWILDMGRETGANTPR